MAAVKRVYMIHIIMHTALNIICNFNDYKKQTVAETVVSHFDLFK